MRFGIDSWVGPAWLLDVGGVSLSRRNLGRLNFSRHWGFRKAFWVGGVFSPQAGVGEKESAQRRPGGSAEDARAGAKYWRNEGRPMA